jgi:hypothetical protein
LPSVVGFADSVEAASVPLLSEADLVGAASAPLRSEAAGFAQLPSALAVCELSGSARQDSVAWGLRAALQFVGPA